MRRHSGQMSIILVIMGAVIGGGMFLVTAGQQRQEMRNAQRSVAYRVGRTGNEVGLELLTGIAQRQMIYQRPAWDMWTQLLTTDSGSIPTASAGGTSVPWAFAGGVVNESTGAFSGIPQFQAMACNPRSVDETAWGQLAAAGSMDTIDRCAGNPAANLNVTAQVTRVFNDFPGGVHWMEVSAQNVVQVVDGAMNIMRQQARIRMPVPPPYCEVDLDPASVANGSRAVKFRVRTWRSVNDTPAPVWQDGVTFAQTGSGWREFNVPDGYVGLFTVSATVNGYPGANPPSYTCTSQFMAQNMCKWNDPDYIGQVAFAEYGLIDVGWSINRPSTYCPGTTYTSNRSGMVYTGDDYIYCPTNSICFVVALCYRPAPPGCDMDCQSGGRLGGFSEPQLHLAFGPINSASCAGTGYWPRNGTGCFAPETLVRRADGRRVRIDRLRPGDRVYNPLTRGDATVRRVIRGPEKKPLVELRYAGERVRVTDGHPVLTPRGWVRAAEVEAGGWILTESVGWTRIDSVGLSSLAEGQEVWNLDLDVGNGAPDDQSALSAADLVVGDWRRQREIE